MKFTPRLSVSAFALMIGLALPVLAHAETITYELRDDGSQDAGVVSSAEPQDDSAYEAPQKELGHKKLYVDHSGKIIPTLSSDGASDGNDSSANVAPPPKQIKNDYAEEDEDVDQPTKKTTPVHTAAKIKKTPADSITANTRAHEEPVKVVATPVPSHNTDKVALQNADAEQSAKKQKHEASFVPVSDSILKARGNGAMAQADKESQIRLAHIRLFHHRISRTEAAKMADSAADTGQGVGASVQ